MAGLSGRKVTRRLKNAVVKTSHTLDARILGALAEADKAIPRSRPRRRTARLFAGLTGLFAVAVIAATVLIVRPAHPADAVEVLRRAMETSKALEWVHAEVTINGKHEGEFWASVRPLRIFSKLNGRVMMTDAAHREKYTYANGSNTLTVTSIFSPSFEAAMSAESFLESTMRSFAHGGGRTTVAEQKVGGRTFTVVTYVNKNWRTQVFIDSATNRVTGYTDCTRDPDTSLRVTVQEFDYPSEGPADVYAIGVPHDARVIDKRQPRALALMEPAWRAKKAFDDTYFAIVCSKTPQKDGSYRPDLVYVVYKSKGRFRVEYYNSTHRPSSSGLWTRQGLDQRLANLDSEDISVVARELKTGKPSEIYFGDDASRASKCLRRSRTDGSLVVEDRDTVLSLYTPEGITWRYMPDGLYMISGVEDKEGRFGPLTALVETQQAVTRDGKIIAIPSRAWYYMNPSRDYAVEEYSHIEDPDADWQEDKDWLEGIDPADRQANKRCLNSDSVLEYGRTPGGRWYARKSLSQSGQSLTLVLIDTAPALPEDLFDVSKVKADDLYDLR